MYFVIVSACLLGNPVRYDGTHKHVTSLVLQRWLAEGRVLSICPEIAGGMNVPRMPAEISTGADGAKVLAGLGKVIDLKGNDVSAEFIAGAEHTHQQAKLNAVRLAVLKEGSPSCGSSYIYDGSFTGAQTIGKGVTASLLESSNIKVFNETQFLEADEYLRKLMAANGNGLCAASE